MFEGCIIGFMVGYGLRSFAVFASKRIKAMEKRMRRKAEREAAANYAKYRREFEENWRECSGAEGRRLFFP